MKIRLRASTREQIAKLSPGDSDPPIGDGDRLFDGLQAQLAALALLTEDFPWLDFDFVARLERSPGSQEWTGRGFRCRLDCSGNLTVDCSEAKHDLTLAMFVTYVPSGGPETTKVDANLLILQRRGGGSQWIDQSTFGENLEALLVLVSRNAVAVNLDVLIEAATASSGPSARAAWNLWSERELEAGRLTPDAAKMILATSGSAQQFDDYVVIGSQCYRARRSYNDCYELEGTRLPDWYLARKRAGPVKLCLSGDVVEFDAGEFSRPAIRDEYGLQAAAADDTGDEATPSSEPAVVFTAETASHGIELLVSPDGRVFVRARRKDGSMA